MVIREWESLCLMGACLAAMQERARMLRLKAALEQALAGPLAQAKRTEMAEAVYRLDRAVERLDRAERGAAQALSRCGRSGRGRDGSLR